MWRIEPGKTPRLYGRADGRRHVSIFGMDIAEGDIDGSGYPEYALTSMGDTKLQKLDPGEAGRGGYPVYRDIAGEVGATAHIPYTDGDRRPSTGWHSEFADFNNAGLLDLFISKGNRAQMSDFADFDPDNLLLGQWTGKFAEARDLAGIALNRQGRGALIVDFNLAGPLDILAVNRGAPASLFRNLGGGEASGHAGWVHVGLGNRRARRNPRAVARRRMELSLRRFRQPVRSARPDKAAGATLVSGPIGLRGPTPPDRTLVRSEADPLGASAPFRNASRGKAKFAESSSAKVSPKRDSRY